MRFGNLKHVRKKWKKDTIQAFKILIVDNVKRTSSPNCKAA